MSSACHGALSAALQALVPVDPSREDNRKPAGTTPGHSLDLAPPVKDRRSAFFG